MCWYKHRTVKKQAIYKKGGAMIMTKISSTVVATPGEKKKRLEKKKGRKKLLIFSTDALLAISRECLPAVRQKSPSWTLTSSPENKAQLPQLISYIL